MQTVRTLAAAARADAAAPRHLATTSDGDAVLVVSAPILSEQIGDHVWTVWAAFGSAEQVVVETRSVLPGGPRGRVACGPDEADDAMAEAEHLCGLAR